MYIFIYYIYIFTWESSDELNSGVWITSMDRWWVDNTSQWSFDFYLYVFLNFYLFILCFLIFVLPFLRLRLYYVFNLFLRFLSTKKRERKIDFSYYVHAFLRILEKGPLTSGLGLPLI